MKIKSMYGESIEEFIWCIHQVSVIWKPKHKDQEPPF
jgi:hypothetical protein